MISKLFFDWLQLDDSFETAEVGKDRNGKKVTKIVEHTAKGEGDKWYYDIHYSDNSFERTFYPCRVYFGSNKECKDLPF